MLAVSKETNENNFQIMITAIKNTTKILLQTDHGRKVYDKLANDHSSYFKSFKKVKPTKK